MKYQVIEQYKHDYSIVVMCNIVGFSESGLYAWRKRPTCQCQREDARLTQEIRQVFSQFLSNAISPTNKNASSRFYPCLRRF